ncbi:MAG: ribosome small subunit-dependent GTPase A [Dehalococcoidia bacterium]|nr:ribosome small subunit-dependent GTPase A [Dehalococcoidia bacterium]
MELSTLGLDDWFQRKRFELNKPGFRMARVTAVNRDNYLVRNEAGEVLAELTGRLMFSAESALDLPAVGDWAWVQYTNSDTFAIIDDLLPRKSVLRRKAAGKRVDYQIIASNIDTAFIMQSCDFNFNLRRLERYLVMANDGNIEPMLLLSKSDLISQEALEQRIAAVRDANIRCEIIAFSNQTGAGLDSIRQVMEPGKTYCLLGSSGVGKTTLLNHLIGRNAFETNLVRPKDGRGRHTTARRQLIVLDEGVMLIDTPGMRELGNIGVTTGIDESFADILELSKGCRFTDCTHTSEVGCSVLQAAQDGILDQARYQSYLRLRKESEHYELSYVEKRKKDRKFGQFIKAAKKQVKNK